MKAVTERMQGFSGWAIAAAFIRSLKNTTDLYGDSDETL